MGSMRWLRAALLVCAAATACQFSVAGIDSGSDMAMGTGVDLGGDSPDLQGCACATGCSETPTHHCLALQPSGPVTAGDYGMSGLGAVDVNANITVNSDTGAIMGPPGLMRPGMSGVVNGVGFHVATQGGGPGVGVFSRRGLEGREQRQDHGHRRQRLRASPRRATSRSTAPSTPRAAPSCRGRWPICRAPAASPAAARRRTAWAPARARPARAGVVATRRRAAAAPATATRVASGGLFTMATPNGGAPWGDLTSPGFVLVGGAGGGGGAGANNGGHGGGGGGAIQIAVNGALVINGVIDVGGCGGLHAGMSDGGGGGGSGGAIVLEAAHVTLASTAVLASNGGGGGAGDDMSSNGGDGNASVVPALGGIAQSAPAVTAATAAPERHARPALQQRPRRHHPRAERHDFGGGGGGGCGRIAVRAQNPTMGGISDSSTAVTPDAADTTAGGLPMTVYGAANFQ